MRIAYVHYLRRTDSACTHVTQFVEAARSLGHAVTVHAMNFGSDEGGVAGRPTIRDALKRPFRRYLHDPKELVSNLKYAFRHFREVPATKADVLLVRDWFLNASCVPVARLLGLPLVLEVNAPAAEMQLYHDAYWHSPRIAARLEAWKLRHARAVTVVSSALRDHFVRRHALPSQKLTVVPNGADTALFRPELPPDPVVRAWAQRRPVIGFVGSFQKWHGAELLARMMLEVGRLRPDSRFVLVGDGPEAAVVREAASALDGRALFVGRVPYQRVPSLVAAFDVAVAPDCGFYMSPLKLVEWMAAGKAVVAPDRGGVRDLVNDGVEGLLFPPDDLQALVSAVIRTVDDPALRRAMGIAAATRARSSLTWRDNATRVLAVCQHVRSHEKAAGELALDGLDGS